MKQKLKFLVNEYAKFVPASLLKVPVLLTFLSISFVRYDARQ